MRFLGGFVLFVLFFCGVTSASQQTTVNNLFFNEDVTPTLTVEDLQKLKFPEGVLEGFMHEYESGLLPKTSVFSIKDPEVRDETIKIFDFLYFTSSFEEFSEVAKLLNSLMNREQFTYVLAVALLHRQDIHIKIPPWYEIFANYFVRNSQLRKFHEAKEKGVESLTLEENHSDTDDEVRYLKEDVQFNNQYYTWMLNWPTWLDYERYGLPKWSRRGELMLYTNIQYALRYGLELYAHGKGEGYFHGEKRLWNDTTVDVDLVNSLGQKIPERPVINYTEYEMRKLMRSHPFLSAILMRVQRVGFNNELVINRTYVADIMTLNGWGKSMWGNLLFNTTESINPEYYGSFMDGLVLAGAEIVDRKYEPAKNVLAYPMAAFRDRIYSTMMLSLDTLTRVSTPGTTPKKAAYPGVTIYNVDTGPLETFYDHLEFDATRAVDETGTRGRYKVRVKRLNHKPFNVTIDILSSNKSPERAYVRLFLAPELFVESSPVNYYDHLFVQIDRFPVTVLPGRNHYVRNSKNFTAFVEDEDIAPSTYDETLSKSNSQCGFPSNLILPKGSKEGLKVTILAIVNPAEEEHSSEEKNGRTFDNFVTCGSPAEDDSRALNFPTDFGDIRFLKDEIHNMCLATTTVHHNDGTSKS